MRNLRAVLIVAVVLVMGLAPVALGMREQPRPIEPPDYAIGRLSISAPFVILQQGDTNWVHVYPAGSGYCPGDPAGGHGGEAEGGPLGYETWCFENYDSCGSYGLCFTHEDVRALASQTGINFWHLSDYLGSQGGQSYNGSYALWCGSDSLWEGIPVECGTWIPGYYPGYGNQWDCQIKLSLSFAITNGCSIYFDPRYDTECKYDYFYLDAYKNGVWNTIAMFNASSNNPGGICGDPTKPNPDYFNNTDTGQPNSADWQARTVEGRPAFAAWVSTNVVQSPPVFRWRFYSDGAWSDADGRGNTDGAAWIDNVKVISDQGGSYFEDFEHGSWQTLVNRGWSLLDPPGVTDRWHLKHDPDPPYEGGDGGERTTCLLDSSIVYRGRPEGGYPSGAAWRNGWFYRLKSPVIGIPSGAAGTGCVVQYDQFMCAKEITCDYTDTKVRFHDRNLGVWCPWINIDGFILYGGCFFWNFDRNEDVSKFYGESADSMQFAWDLMDVSQPDQACRGKHGGTENIIDNPSIGFFDGTGTIFAARGIDIFQDTFHEDLPLYNSFFDVYDEDTLAWYRNFNHRLPRTRQLYLEVSDKDGLQAVRLYGSIDKGATWTYVDMTQAVPFDPNHPELGGEYYATFYPTDFGLQTWSKGTEIWYYVWAQDTGNREGYFPRLANPNDPGHTGDVRSYFEVSIMPMYPDTYQGVKVLLVDGYGRRNYDFSQCFAQDDSVLPLEDIYEMTLRDAGYCYDKFDISGAGSNIHLHPDFWKDSLSTMYDAVVWFTGPYFSNYLVDADVQEWLFYWVNSGGKVLFAGDRIAYCFASEDEGGAGEDSIDGKFLNCILGCDYIAEMPGAFAVPYVYLRAPTTIYVDGSPVNLRNYFDKVLIYRECPFLRDMSYVAAIGVPELCPGWTAQSFMDVDNTTYDGGIYVETPGGGKVVFINYDFSGFINHTVETCSGQVPPGRPSFTGDTYYGRVEVLRTALELLFGLPSNGSGGGGTSGTDTRAEFRWALSQNTPNPMTDATVIRFEVARTSDVSIKVYNAMGQLVKTLASRRYEAGKHQVSWDGTNDYGQRVSSGVYWYKMEAGDFQATKKVLVLK
ncbi:MAG: FlgD immunoglobulin-like domain containing protein [bacterium]